MKKNISWFSLVEILVGIVIVSIVMVAAFQALTSVWIAKVKLIEKAEIEKQAYFISEKFFELIKKGGTIDYEEYWNRYSYNTSYWSWHFLQSSGFWNFGRTGVPGTSTYGWRIYHCISNSWNMWVDGCLADKNINYILATPNINRTNQPQRYTQYQRQFIDRNSDNDSDNGDEDGDGSIVWDDDDLFIWEWPNAFSWALNINKVWELYLINSTWDERTYFRWRVETATGSFVPTWAVCDYSNPRSPVGDACQWTIEILKLSWADRWYNHTSAPDWDSSEGDGVIDTWLIHEDFLSSAGDIIAWSNTQSYWQPIFPDSINIRDFEVYVYPNKDLRYSWKDNDPSILVSPYIQIKYTIEPSLKVQARIKWEKPTVDISTVIQLSSLDLR